MKGLKICVLIVLYTKLVQSLLCDKDEYCFGGYPYCCSGYCKKSCNLTCTSSSDCGSLGHLQEKCCNGQCVGINSVCHQKVLQKTSLSPVHIVVLVLCIVVFVAVGTCALASYLCKCGYLYRRRTNMASTYVQERPSVNYLGKVLSCRITGQPDDSSSPLQLDRFPETSWVGKDFIQARSFRLEK